MLFPKTSAFLYKYFAKPLFFRCDPEWIHHAMVGAGAKIARFPGGSQILSAWLSYKNPILEQNILGITFPNPLGLSAGFDKNGDLLHVMESVGFGFMEIGSVTAKPCVGNPSPRLWRLPKSSALLVWYGLANKGAEALVKKLAKHRSSAKIPVGINVARTNDLTTVSREDAIRDYCTSCTLLAPYATYLTINISCPNSCDGEAFTRPEALEDLLHAIDALNLHIPIFLKLPLDQSDDEALELVNIANAHRIAGFIVANLHKTFTSQDIHPDERQVLTKGGISGKPNFPIMCHRLKILFQATKGSKILIASGGIFTADDAYTAISYGASLVQIITSMIYEGPQNIGVITKGLAERLEKEHLSLSQLIGKDTQEDHQVQAE